jgi:hypothetical protein
MSEIGVMIDASLYMIGWRAGSQFMIGWGVGPCYVILQEEGFLPMSGWSRWLMIEFQMINQCAGIQNKSQFMITLIGLSGVQRV